MKSCEIVRAIHNMKMGKKIKNNEKGKPTVWREGERESAKKPSIRLHVDTLVDKI